MLELTAKDFTEISLPDKVHTVILDFDNTCYEYEPCHKESLEAVANWFNQEVNALVNFNELYNKSKLTVKKRIPNQAASHARILYFQNILETIQSDNVIEISLKMERLYWEEFIRHMRPVHGLFKFLADCKENGTKVVVVTDLTTSIQCQKIVGLGLNKYVDILVTSEEVGVEKPNPSCFKLALEKTQCQANEAIIIGDNYECDVVGARALKIHSILITHEKTTEKLSTR